jgi:hypothetical protein
MIKLKDALLCINCDCVYDGFKHSECPQCCSVQSLKLKSYLLPLVEAEVELCKGISAQQIREATQLPPRLRAVN